jgi:hypothetical protein
MQQKMLVQCDNMYVCTYIAIFICVELRGEINNIGNNTVRSCRELDRQRKAGHERSCLHTTAELRVRGATAHDQMIFSGSYSWQSETGCGTCQKKVMTCDTTVYASVGRGMTKPEFCPRCCCCCLLAAAARRCCCRCRRHCRFNPNPRTPPKPQRNPPEEWGA